MTKKKKNKNNRETRLVYLFIYLLKGDTVISKTVDIWTLFFSVQCLILNDVLLFWEKGGGERRAEVKVRESVGCIKI